MNYNRINRRKEQRATLQNTRCRCFHREILSHFCCLLLFSARSYPTLLRPHGLQPARLLCSLSEEFSKQGYWSRLPFPSPGDLPDPGIKPKPPALQVGSLWLSHQGSPAMRPPGPMNSVLQFQSVEKEGKLRISHTELV